MQRIAIVAGWGLSMAGAANGQSLHLSYTVTEFGPGVYRYEFTLTPCAGWEAGMAWRGLVWGDCASCPTLLPGFEGSPGALPVGPWTEYTTISGEHNGPMFGDAEAWWEPASAFESLRWWGNAPVELEPGELLFSALEGRGGAVAVEYKPAVDLGEPCYADCDGNRELDLFDFLCFQNAFATGDQYADCDHCGSLDFFDFLCYIHEFETGCP